MTFTESTLGAVKGDVAHWIDNLGEIERWLSGDQLRQILENSKVDAKTVEEAQAGLSDARMRLSGFLAALDAEKVEDMAQDDAALRGIEQKWDHQRTPLPVLLEALDRMLVYLAEQRKGEIADTIKHLKIRMALLGFVEEGQSIVEDAINEISPSVFPSVASP